jgi:hypothetical protein
MAVIFPSPADRKLSRTNNWNIGKIKQLELENQNLIPPMTNTRLHAEWKFISRREGKKVMGMVRGVRRKLDYFLSPAFDLNIRL